MLSSLKSITQCQWVSAGAWDNGMQNYTVFRMVVVRAFCITRNLRLPFWLLKYASMIRMEGIIILHLLDNQEVLRRAFAAFCLRFTATQEIVEVRKIAKTNQKCCAALSLLSVDKGWKKRLRTYCMRIAWPRPTSGACIGKHACGEWKAAILCRGFFRMKICRIEVRMFRCGV